MSTETIQPETAVLDTYVDGHPFTISGDYEAVAEQLPRADKYLQHMKAELGAVAVVEAPRIVANPEPEYVSLAALSDRETARRALKALGHDIATFGRTKLYRQFKQRLHEEQDLQVMVDLGIVESVRCRLHEKQLAKARGVR